MIKKVIYLQGNLSKNKIQKTGSMAPNFFTYGFAGHLSRQFKKYNNDWEVETWRVDFSSDKYIETTIQGVLFKIFPGKGSRFLGFYSKSFFNAIKMQPRGTILNIQSIHVPFTYQILLLVKKRFKVVLTHHGDFSPYFVMRNGKLFKRVLSLFYILLEKVLFNRVSYFFVLDVGHLKYLEKSIKLCQDNYRIQPTGVDFGKFEKIDRDKSCEFLNLSREFKYILYVGQYYHFKQVDRLVQVFREVKKRYHNVKLLVVGGKPSDIYYDLVISEAGIIDLGLVLHDEMSRIYSIVDAYILMAFRSDYFGGIGQACIEAMACHVPVVSSSLRSISEPIRSQVGICPENEDLMVDQIVSILNAEVKFPQIRYIAQQHYDNKVIQQATLQVYKELVESDEN